MLGDDLRWVPTDWHVIGSVTGRFELEWQRSLEDLDDGSLAIRHEGRTIRTIDGIDTQISVPPGNEMHLSPGVTPMAKQNVV